MNYLQMPFHQFDQTEEGWRSVAHGGDCAEAARLLEAYLDTHRAQLEDWQNRTLHFHAAQMHAFSGDINAALSHLPETRVPDEPIDPLIRWNDYVDATEAFLRRDLPLLIAARERIAIGKTMPDGCVANLAVVDRLIASFAKPYSEAY